MGLLWKSRSVDWICSYWVLLVVLCCLLTPISADKKLFGESCTKNAECKSSRCSKISSTCTCSEVHNKGSKAKVFQLYDSELNMCFSQVDQLCTLKTGNPKRLQFKCIPGAICDPSQKINSRVSFCACKPGYKSHGYQCVSQTQPPKTHVEETPSMDQTKPMPSNRRDQEASTSRRNHPLQTPTPKSQSSPSPLLKGTENGFIEQAPSFSSPQVPLSVEPGSLKPEVFGVPSDGWKGRSSNKSGSSTSKLGKLYMTSCISIFLSILLSS